MVRRTIALGLKALALAFGFCATGSALLATWIDKQAEWEGL